MKTGRICSLLVIFSLFLQYSCEPLSYREYEMEAYTGSLDWECVNSGAEWSRRFDHAAVSFKDKLWIFGGYDMSRMKEDSYLEDVWSSDDGKEWTLRTGDAPWKGRRGHTVTVFNDGSGDALFLVGGFEVDEETGYRQYTNDVWKSSDGISWIQVKERTYLPKDPAADFLPRFNHTCVAVTYNGTDYLYLAGGSTMLENVEGSYAMHYFNDVWRSGDGVNWTRVDNTDFGMRTEHASCVDPVSGRMYIQGGIHGFTFDNKDFNNHPVPDFYNLWYSDDGETWVSGNLPDLERGGHALLYFEKSLWLLPGKIDGKIIRYGGGDVYYTYVKKEDSAWELDSKGSAFSGRHSYATVIFKNKIWILGGETADNGPNNDVWCGSLDK